MMNYEIVSYQLFSEPDIVMPCIRALNFPYFIILLAVALSCFAANYVYSTQWCEMHDSSPVGVKTDK